MGRASSWREEREKWLCGPTCPITPVGLVTPSEGTRGETEGPGEEATASLEILPPPGQFCHRAPKGQGVFVTLSSTPLAGARNPQGHTTSIPRTRSSLSAFSFSSLSRDRNRAFQHRKASHDTVAGLELPPGQPSNPHSPHLSQTSRKGTLNFHSAAWFGGVQTNPLWLPAWGPPAGCSDPEGVSVTYLDVFLLLVMVIQEALSDRAELLIVPLHLRDGGLDALQQLLVLLQGGR